ncbi:MAG: VOC family protein [Pseudomonadota bacterium]
MLHPPLVRLTLYTRKIDEMAEFYRVHFGYTAWGSPDDRIVELRPPGPGAILHLHPLAKSQKAGQVLVKLGFEVEDVPTFVADAAARGLTFGTPMKGDGYLFANAKDPAGNSISVTSRGAAHLNLQPWNPDPT